jgi:hypothetical protein
MSIEIAGIISEGYNIGRIIGFFEENAPSSSQGKVIVQIGKEVFIIDYPMTDWEYDLIKMECPIGSTVVIGVYDGRLYIERSVLGDFIDPLASLDTHTPLGKSSRRYDL